MHRAAALKAPSRLRGALAIRYLTEEWAEKALERIEADEGVAEAVEGLDLSILAIILDRPDGCYGFIFVRFEDGALAEYRVGHDYMAVTHGLGTPTFVVSGRYEVFSQVQKGELTERKAILTGQLHLTGSLWKALRHMSAMEAVTRALNSIECEI